MASYNCNASRNSLTLMYSSAVCERDDWPGPIFNEGKRISAWSLSVGEPNSSRPRRTAARTRGWSSDMCEECRRVERGTTSHPCVWAAMMLSTCSLV